MMCLNRSVTIINARLQLLDMIYIYIYIYKYIKKKEAFVFDGLMTLLGIRSFTLHCIYRSNLFPYNISPMIE